MTNELINDEILKDSKKYEFNNVSSPILVDDNIHKAGYTKFSTDLTSKRIVNKTNKCYIQFTQDNKEFEFINMTIGELKRCLTSKGKKELEYNYGINIDNIPENLNNNIFNLVPGKTCCIIDHNKGIILYTQNGKIPYYQYPGVNDITLSTLHSILTKEAFDDFKKYQYKNENIDIGKLLSNNECDYILSRGYDIKKYITKKEPRITVNINDKSISDMEICNSECLNSLPNNILSDIEQQFGVNINYLPEREFKYEIKNGCFYIINNEQSHYMNKHYEARLMKDKNNNNKLIFVSNSDFTIGLPALKQMLNKFGQNEFSKIIRSESLDSLNTKLFEYKLDGDGHNYDAPHTYFMIRTKNSDKAKLGVRLPDGKLVKVNINSYFSNIIKDKYIAKLFDDNYGIDTNKLSDLLKRKNINIRTLYGSLYINNKEIIDKNGIYNVSSLTDSLSKILTDRKLTKLTEEYGVDIKNLEKDFPKCRYKYSMDRDQLIIKDNKNKLVLVIDKNKNIEYIDNFPSNGIDNNIAQRNMLVQNHNSELYSSNKFNKNYIIYQLLTQSDKNKKQSERLSKIFKILFELYLTMKKGDSFIDNRKNKSIYVDKDIWQDLINKKHTNYPVNQYREDFLKFNEEISNIVKQNNGDIEKHIIKYGIDKFNYINDNRSAYWIDQPMTLRLGYRLSDYITNSNKLKKIYNVKMLNRLSIINEDVFLRNSRKHLKRELDKWKNKLEQPKINKFKQQIVNKKEFDINTTTNQSLISNNDSSESWINKIKDEKNNKSNNNSLII